MLHTVRLFIKQPFYLVQSMKVLCKIIGMSYSSEEDIITAQQLLNQKKIQKMRYWVQSKNSSNF
jgi:hypothetical protein